MDEKLNLKAVTVNKSDIEYFINMNYNELMDLFKHPVDNKLDERVKKIFSTDYFFLINGFDIDGEIKDYIDLSSIFYKTVKFIDKQMSLNNLETMSFHEVDLLYRFDPESGFYVFGYDGFMRF